MLFQSRRTSFSFRGLYPSIVRAFSILIPLKRGRGFLHFFCRNRINERAV